MDQKEQEVNCPYCMAPITVLLDPSVAEQEYIEDCQVCCNPIEFRVVFEYVELLKFEIKRTNE